MPHRKGLILSSYKLLFRMLWESEWQVLLSKVMVWSRAEEFQLKYKLDKVGVEYSD